jgi:hypothetical protein
MEIARSFDPKLEPYEKSQVIENPEDILPIINKIDPEYRLAKYDGFGQPDEDYEKIVKSIPTLTKFINSVCDAEDINH